jgi:hypothetical protein
VLVDAQFRTIVENQITAAPKNVKHLGRGDMDRQFEDVQTILAEELNLQVLMHHLLSKLEPIHPLLPRTLSLG